MFRGRQLGLITGADFLVRCAYQVGKAPVLPLFAAALGAGEVFLGLIVSVSTLTGMLLKPLFGVLSDRWGPPRMAAGGHRAVHRDAFRLPPRRVAGASAGRAPAARYGDCDLRPGDDRLRRGDDVRRQGRAHRLVLAGPQRRVHRRTACRRRNVGVHGPGDDLHRGRLRKRARVPAGAHVARGPASGRSEADAGACPGPPGGRLRAEDALRLARRQPRCPVPGRQVRGKDLPAAAGAVARRQPGHGRRGARRPGGREHGPEPAGRPYRRPRRVHEVGARGHAGDGGRLWC